jgi:ABC-type multidrug transport system fused ATPase/permease subunit
MNEIKRQIGLIRSVKHIRSQYQQLKLTKRHFKFLADFCRRHRWLISGLMILLITQGLVEALLIIFSRDELSSQQKLWLSPFFWQFLGIFLTLFFINSYYSIRQEKTLGVWLSNSIRRRLFKSYLDQPLATMDQEKKADLIAKIAYQLPLMSMGVTNSFFGLARWLIYVMVATLIAWLSGLNWIFVLSVSLVFSLLIAVAAYFVARRYISQEVTYYSQIIRQIDIDLTEKYFLKDANQEPLALDRFDRLVDFDSFFRVRRDLWMKMGAKAVFAILLLLSVLTHFFSTGFFTWINSIGPETKFLFLFLMIYFSRALNESLRVGLYYYPARLGLFLTITQAEPVLRRENRLSFQTDIRFYSRKTKLSENSPYYRNFKLEFAKAERCLFHGPLPAGKTTLARLLAGLEAFKPKAVKVKVDGRRLDYQTWQKFGQGTCFFNPDFRSAKSLMEFALGKDKEVTDFSEIEIASKILKSHPRLAALVTPDDNFNASATAVFSNNLSAFALYAWHCLVTKPELIIIDNSWMDAQYIETVEILKILDKELPEATLIVFSREDNDYLNYGQKYAMDEKFQKTS